MMSIVKKLVIDAKMTEIKNAANSCLREIDRIKIAALVVNDIKKAITSKAFPTSILTSSNFFELGIMDGLIDIPWNWSQAINKLNRATKVHVTPDVTMIGDLLNSLDMFTSMNTLLISYNRNVHKARLKPSLIKRQ